MTGEVRVKVTHIVFAALMATASAVSAAEAPDNRTPLERYRGGTQFYLLSCSLSFKLATLKAEGDQSQDEKNDYAGCITKGKTVSKSNLGKALRTVKKPKAQEALKTYHVAFVSALEGIFPGTDERRISYEQRQQALKDKVTEAWARFEVEQ